MEAACFGRRIRIGSVVRTCQSEGQTQVKVVTELKVKSAIVKEQIPGKYSDGGRQETRDRESIANETGVHWISSFFELLGFIMEFERFILLLTLAATLG